MHDTRPIAPPRRGEEQVRLSDHQRAIQRLIGLLPPGIDTLSHVLHLFCGGGDWCLEVANRYQISLLGLDTREMIGIVRVYAHVAGIDDLVSSGKRWSLHLFPDETFDFVYAHDLSLRGGLRPHRFLQVQQDLLEGACALNPHSLGFK